MKTSSFHVYTGPGRIAISRSVPRHTPAGYRVARWMAPPAAWHHLPPEEFAKHYLDLLDAIGARQAWERLHDLTGDVEPILLCWEKLHRPGEWCHRRMVGAWFERELGVEVPELGRQETLDFA